MFIISQYILKQSNVVPDLMTMTTYSIVSGIVIYASLYAYILLYHKSLLPFFNKIIAYVVGVDVLLSMIYYYTIMNSQKSTIPDDKVNDAVDDDSGSYTDSDAGSDADSDVDSDGEYETELDQQTFNQEELDQNVLKSEFQNVEVSVNQQMNLDNISNIIDAKVNTDTDKITQVNTSQQVPQVSLSDKNITNDDNNLLNNLLNQLNNTNPLNNMDIGIVNETTTTNVSINDNINVINDMNDTNESGQTIKRRRRRTKKEIEQDLLTKTSNKTSDLNKMMMDVDCNDNSET